MNPSKIFSVLDLAFRAREQGNIFNPCFVGAPGLGKTEIVEQYAKAKGLGYLVITSALYEAPDVKGFPIVQVVNGRQRQTYATPDYWPDEGKGIVVLEEVNRGTTSIMNCWMALTDGRRGFDGYKLPKGWIVVGCINPEGDGYDVNTMDHALRDRFEMFDVAYDRPIFTDYMKASNWHKDIINFVESGIWAYKTPEEIGNTPGAKYVSPRTMSKLNTALMAEFSPHDEMEIYSTILGTNVAKDFYNFRHNEAPVMMNDLNKNLKGSLEKLKAFSNPDNYKNGMISLTVKDIVEVDTIGDDVLIEVVLTIPVEQGTTLIRDLEFKRKDDALLQRLCKTNPSVKSLFKSVLKFGK